MEIYKLRRNAILLDFACIAVAMVVLYLASKQMLPQWALIAGALVAAALMCASIWYLLRARKLLKQIQESSDKEQDAPSEVS